MWNWPYHPKFVTKALCAGGGNVTFGDSIYRSAGLIDSCSG